ncbi:MAG TPA: hypothetical protein VLR90_21180 [Blastocatellia bacterium]|nr:hypothetical protein [Blastocatellia bacterium]
MERLIAGPFAETLRRGRDRFNTKFAYARRKYPTLDEDVFTEHLRFVLAPIAEAVHTVAPDRVDETIEALYDISLELTGKAYFGRETRYTALVTAWRKLFPRLAKLLATEPAKITSAVTNAVYNLSATVGARPTFWIDAMIDIGSRCKDVPSFLEAGKVVAWRAGLAHYRQSALEAVKRIEPELARVTLALPESSPAQIETIVERLMTDPWLAPAMAAESEPREKRLRIVSVVGAFRGYGGVFVSPPEVALSEGEIVAFDNENCWAIMADLFGSTFQRIGNTLPEIDKQQSADFTIDKSGRVTKDSRSAAFAQLAGANSTASNETTLAVTIPHSHSVYLIALT